MISLLSFLWLLTSNLWSLASASQVLKLQVWISTPSQVPCLKLFLKYFELYFHHLLSIDSYVIQYNQNTVSPLSAPPCSFLASLPSRPTLFLSFIRTEQGEGKFWMRAQVLLKHFKMKPGTKVIFWLAHKKSLLLSQ